MKTKPTFTHCVWWFETDDFSGRTTQHWRDFESQQQAEDWMKNQPGTSLSHPLLYVGEIRDLPWHQSHGIMSKANAGQHD